MYRMLTFEWPDGTRTEEKADTRPDPRAKAFYEVLILYHGAWIQAGFWLRDSVDNHKRPLKV